MIGGLQKGEISHSFAEQRYKKDVIKPGMIIFWGSGISDDELPPGFLPCDGREVSRFLYANLFAAIGTTYGTGNGTTTFNLPNSASRTPVGDNGSTYTIGDTGGEEEVQLTAGQMPSHTHSFSDSGHTHGASLNETDHVHDYNRASDQTFDSGATTVIANNSQVSTASSSITNINASTDSVSTGVTLQNTGSNGSHSNMMSWLAVNLLIKV